MVITPDAPSLPFTMRKGLKYFELVAEPVERELLPYIHEFNFSTMNGRCFPFVTPLNVQFGERMRIRLANSMEKSHPIHIHGHQFSVTASDGNIIKPQDRMTKSTIHVSSGETWDIEFIANN